MCSDGCEVVYIVMWHHPDFHPNSYHHQGCIFSYLFNLSGYPHKICTFKGGYGYGSKYFFLQFSVMLKTILTLSDTKNHPFYKKKSIFSKITTPILHTFQPLHGVTTWLPTFVVPQKGWSITSFITPESCIALVYSEPSSK